MLGSVPVVIAGTYLELFVQAELASCLRRLAAHGAEDFYRGEIARAIDRDMRRQHPLIDTAFLLAQAYLTAVFVLAALGPERLP